MAEPFSVVAAAVGVIDVGTRLSARINSLVKKWINAPAEIMVIHNEIVDLTVVLDHLRYAGRVGEANTAPGDEALVKALNDELGKAKECLIELETMLDRLVQMRRFKKGLKWIRQNPAVEEKKIGLRHIRLQINDLLRTHNLLSNTRIELELKTIQSDMKERFDKVDNAFNDVNNAIFDVQARTSQHHGDLSTLATSMEQNFNIIQSALRERRLEDTNLMEAITSRMDTRYEHLASRLESLAARDAHIFSHQPHSVHARHPTSSHRLFQPDQVVPLLRVVTRRRRSRCSSSCHCLCHQQRKYAHTWQFPQPLRGALGHLFLGYSGYPTSRVSCDLTSCLDGNLSHLEAMYIFPAWFLRYSLFATFQRSVMGRPTFGLIFHPLVEEHIGGVMHSVTSNNIEALKRCLATDPDCVNHQTFLGGQTALWTAVSYGNIEAIRLLLHAGADSDVLDRNGLSAGLVAARIVLTESFPPETCDQLSALIPISRYIEEMELSTLSEIALGLRSGSLIHAARENPMLTSCINDLDQSGYTALCWAVRCGNRDAVDYLLALGADINAPNRIHQTPLIMALRSDTSAQCFSMLLNSGADLSVKTMEGYYAIHIASALGRVDEVKLLVQAGVDVNTRSAYDRSTALHLAAFSDHIEVLDYLISAGADISLQSNNGSYALLIATCANSYRVVHRLLLAEADYCTPNENDGSILHCAAVCSDAKTLSILAQHGLVGVDPDWKSPGGLTAEEIFQRRLCQSDSEDPELEQTFRHLIHVVSGSEIGPNVEGANQGPDTDVFYDAMEQVSTEAEQSA